MILNQDFREFIKLLNDHNVQYLVVGGFALAIHGYPPNRIDLMTSIDGVSFKEAYSDKEIYREEKTVGQAVLVVK